MQNEGIHVFVKIVTEVEENCGHIKIEKMVIPKFGVGISFLWKLSRLSEWYR